MPSIRPHIPSSTESKRLSRAERRKRRAAANAAGIAPLLPPPPPTAPPSPTVDRDLALSLMRGRAAFELVLTEACHTHDARPGQPCWEVDEVLRGLCGPRIRRCLDRDPIDRATNPGRPRKAFSTGRTLEFAR